MHTETSNDLLRPSQKPDPEPADEPVLYTPMNDALISTKQSACLALANIGNKLDKAEERQALADKYPVFNALQPLLSSTDEILVDNARKALALYSSSQDFPFVLKLLEYVVQRNGDIHTN